MTKDEALKLALEALEFVNQTGDTQTFDMCYADKAITAIKEALAQSERDYERGFIDGMQKQMQSSVDKAVNAMSQRTWVGLTDEEITELHYEIKVRLMGTYKTEDIYRVIEAKLKEKNT